MDIQKMVDSRIEELECRSRPVSDPAEFSEFIDAALAEIAGRVLEITDQLARDYTRLERDTLKSRLAVLKSVEAVLDIVLSLRRKARSLSLASRYNSMDYPHFEDLPPAAFNEGVSAVDGWQPHDGRASMRGSGVAALFKKTR